MKSELQIALEELDKALKTSLDNQQIILKAQTGIKRYISEINRAYRSQFNDKEHKTNKLI